ARAHAGRPKLLQLAQHVLDSFYIDLEQRRNLLDLAVQKPLLVERTDQVVDDRVLAGGEGDMQIALQALVERDRRGDRQQRVELVVGWNAGVVALGFSELEILVETVDTGGAAQRATTAATQRLFAFQLVERRVLFELLLDELLEFERRKHQHII